MDSVEDADVNLSLRHSVRLATNPTDSTGANNHKKTVKLWKRALRRVQSSDLDPWLDFPTHDLPIRTAVRHRYSAIKKKWVVDNILIRLESVPFDRGAMRECFRMKKLPNAESSTPDWQHASNYVAKRYINPVNRQVYFDDVRLQIEAKLWGEAFNRHNPPKKVDIFQLSVIEVHRSNQAHSGPDDDSCKGEVDLYHIERFMEGEYRKYNSNSGFVDEQLRNTPQAFSHFTFERSGHRLLVVDIQGVGDLYTDPQIHTSDGIGYSDGNLGTKGMAYFFHSHRCNPLCEYLGLTPFDLAPSELATDSSVTKNHEGDAAAHPSADECELSNGDWDPSILENTNSDAVKTPEKQPPWKQRPRRRCVSFNQSSSCNSRFGPTVARSTESVHHSLSFGPRQRTGSSSFFSDALCPSSSDNLLKDRVSSLTALDGDYFNSLCTIKMGPEVPIRGIDEKLLVQFKVPLPIKNPSPSIGTELCPKPLYVADSLSKSRPVRNRVASGDSGYYGRMNFLPPTAPGYGDHQSPLIDPLIDVFSVSSSLTEHSFPTSPSPVPGISRVPFHRTLSTGDEEFILPLSNSHHNNLGDFIPHAPHRIAGMFGLSRRPRNLSESSDLDLEEDHRGTGNLLHQLMHESHRPSCAGHPTNLDQEIGQSVLGQIHHELARLHEAGRFLPTCKGGWSHAGLGGHLLKNGSDDSLNQSECNKHLQHTEQKIDWAAVLFHERHAAQLGCLEAMIVMAHYHLGLPTQLLFDCPIKPVPSDFRSGVDYLWRAAEGGDRRCMILLARYLDVATTLSHPVQHINNSCDFLLLPMLQSLSPDMLPSVSPDSWSEAIGWYQKAVDAACVTSNGAEDEGLDAEGGYDAAEDLLPVYRILERMAEMYSVGGFGLEQDFSRVGDLFAHAGELAVTAMQGRLATKYFDLSEEAYAKIT